MATCTLQYEREQEPTLPSFLPRKDPGIRTSIYTIGAASPEPANPSNIRDARRDDLCEQMTLLRSLLRLDADGIADAVDLKTGLEATRDAVVGLLELVEADEDAEEEYQEPAAVGLALTCASDVSSEISRTPSPVLSSSWDSSPTSATSVSPRDSLRKTVSPLAGYYGPRSQSAPVFERDLDADEDAGWCSEGESIEDDGDETFKRMSTMLEVMKMEVEEAVTSRFDEDDEEDEQGDEDEFEDTREGQESEEADEAATPVGSAGHERFNQVFPEVGKDDFDTAPSTPRSVSYIVQEIRRSSIDIPPQPSSYTTSPVRRRRTRKRRNTLGSIPEGSANWPLAKPVTEDKPTEAEEDKVGDAVFNLETAVLELMERRNEQETMFRYVWMWLMGGGLAYLLVGWLLQLGCDCACKA